ncbi:DNA-binding transcriptional LysR family regulator [Duganella sp. 1224]|uniref:LysR family transcriptional regulator n=1 Tax=Duganella sp. 1224 TaxID=2587052 RepID=UPI0015CDF50C|nr:LysR family transcriptional regulator [Duganella sp. 1224]NYE59479.1 DNA-binding transcriptional LysR family regulator [Duganella sp. 1224]
MEYENFNDLLAFVTVAREGSFTRAARKMGVSQSALSHTIRGLETRLGIRLLTRTTRSVSPTEAGERLLRTAAPRFDEITQELASLNELRDKPAGTIRITAAEHSANNVLWPKLAAVMHDYPDVKIDITIDYGMTDIVSQRYDAGVRVGSQVEKDMIAVRIGADFRMALVATPEYFARRGKPRTPDDLQQHSCINLRLPTHGNLQVWELEKNGTPHNVRVDGQWVFNNTTSRLRAALAGYGIASVPEDMACDHVKEGTLVRVLKEWCPVLPGYHLYYPSRRQSSPAFQLVVDALRL